MALPANIRLKPLHGDDLDVNGQGQIQQARPRIQQFLLNVFGAWNQNKPQLYKDVPALDMVTPQIAYATGQGSAEESMAGFGGPASIRGGVQYGRYGRNAVNYGAQRAKQYVAKEGQQFIKSQIENAAKNPLATNAVKPASPFTFTTQSTAQPSAAAAMTQLSKAEAGSFMGGLKPGSVEPVIPLSVRARVAGIDAKNAVKGAAGSVSRTVMGVPKAVGAVTKTASDIIGKNPYNAAAIVGAGGLAGLGIAGLSNRSEYVTRNESDNKQTKPVEQRTSQKAQPGDKNPKNNNSIYPNAPRQSVKPDAKITGNTVPAKPAPGPVVTPAKKASTKPVEVRKKERPNVKTTSPVVDKAVQQVAGPKAIPNTSALVDQAEQQEKVNANQPIYKGIQVKALPSIPVPTKTLAGDRPLPTHNSTGNFYAGEISLEPNYIPGILNRGVKTQMKCGGVLKMKKKKK